MDGHSVVRNSAWRGFVILLAVLLTAALAPATAQAQSVPEELDILCVSREDKVVQANAASDCSRKEVAIDVPAQRPVHLCARDDFGLVRYTTDPAACTRDHEFPITIPDDGPHILCSKNIKRGRIQDRGELRYADNAARCDSNFYTAFITPAAPQANPDAFTVDEDSLLTVAARGVLDNDADASGGTLTARLLSGPAIGSVALATDGGFTYDPRGLFEHLDAGQQQAVTFTYATSDGELESEAATATINVTGRNDRPTATADSYITDEDTALLVVRPGVLGNDGDTEGNPLTAHLVDGVDRGILDLTDDGGLRFDPAGQFEDLGDGQSADVTFTYVARDGSDDSDAATVTVTVTGINDAPVAGADQFTTDENSPITITAADLLGNDSDVEGDTLTVVDLGNGNPAAAFTFHPTTIDFDPTAAFDDLEDGQTATATFTYAVSDGAITSPSATATITVTGISAAVPVDDSAETDEDTPLDIDILANDTVAGGTVAIQAVSGSRGSATFANGVATFDPRGHHDDLAAGQSRLDRFGYTLTNAEGVSRQALVTIVVHGRDDTPVAIDDNVGNIAVGSPSDIDAASGVIANDTDADTPLSGLVAILVSPPSKGRLTLRPDGSFTFDPAGEVSDGDVLTFRYRVSDGTSESGTATVTLATGQDFPPEIPPGQTFDLITDNPGLFDAVVQAVDSEGPVVFTLGAASTYFQIDRNSGRITTTQGVPPIGRYDLTVTATDVAGQTDTETVTVFVKVQFDPTDDVFEAIGNTPLLAGVSAAPDQIAVVDADGVLANDGDASSLAVTAGQLPTTLGGTVDIAADGTFTYQPPRPQRGAGANPCDGTSTWDGTMPATTPDGRAAATDTFTYDVVDTVDGGTASPTATIHLTDVVWYVDAAATGTGCGSAADPYADLAELDQPDDDDAGPDLIFLRGDDGQEYDGITLEDGQRLSGQGVALTVSGFPLLGGGPADEPTLTDSVVLALDNTLRGFSVLAPTGVVSAVDTSGDPEAVGAADIDLRQVTSTTAGPALRLGTGDVDVAIAELSGQSSDSSVVMAGTGGSVALGDVQAGGLVQIDATTSTVDIDTLTVSGHDGLQLGDTVGPITVDVVDSTVDGTAVWSDAQVGTLTIGSLSASGADIGLAVTENTGSVQVDDAQITDVELGGTFSRGIRVRDNDGQVVIDDGVISADTPPATDAAAPAITPILLQVDGGSGTVRNDADVSLGLPADPPSGSAARSVVVTGLSGLAHFTQRGAVVGRGAGISLSGNGVDTLVAFTGGTDIATTPYVTPGGLEGGVALSAVATTLAMTGSGHNLASAGAAGLRLVSTRVGADGINIQRVDADAPAFEAGSQNLVGNGVDLVGITSAGGQLLVDGGTITNPARAGVRLEQAPGVIIGGLSILEPQTIADQDISGVGVSVSNSDGVLLLGTQITRATKAGVVSTGSADLVLDTVSVTDSDGKGVYLPNPEGTTRLRGTTISDSQDIQLHVDDDGTLVDSTTVIVENSAVSGTPAEVNGMQVDAVDGTDLTFQIGGDLVSGALGGRNAVAVFGTGGSNVQVDVTRTTLGNTAEDGILLQADNAMDDGTFKPATLRFDIVDLTAVDNGGIQGTGGAGVHAVSRNDATVTGSIARVEVQAAQQYGVLLDNADDTVIDQLTILAPREVGLAVHNTRNIAVDRLSVEGAPDGHAVELWGVEDITIRRSRVDLRSLPDQPDPPTDSDGDPVPEEERDFRTPTGVADTCTNSDNAQERVEFIPPSFRRVPPVIVEGVSGIYARHVEGTLEITDTTVRGATLHQIMVFNGILAPGVADPVPRPAPRFGITTAARLLIGDVLLLDNDPNRAGMFAGAGALGQLDVEMLPAQSETVGAHLFCAVDGGQVHAEGAPSLFVTLAEPAIIAKASATNSDVTYDFDGSQLEFDPTINDVFSGFLAGLRYLFAIQLIEEDGGNVSGTLRNTTLVNPPGDGVQVASSGDLIENLTVVNPAGAGLVVEDVDNVQVIGLDVSEAGAEAVRITRADTVTITSATLTEPDGAGVLVTDAANVSLNGLTVTDSVGPAIDAATVTSLSATDATLSTSVIDAEIRPGVRARNVLPLSLEDVAVSGFDDIPVDVVNGSSHPDVAGLPSLPCGVVPCLGSVGLTGMTVATSPAGGPSVRVLTGPDVEPTVRLGGDSVTDAPIHLHGVDSDVTVESTGATIDVTGGGDGLSLEHRFGSLAQGSLTVDLTDVDMGFSGDQVAAPGTGIDIDGAVSTTLTDTVVDGAGAVGVDVDAGNLTVVGGRFSNLGSHGLVSTSDGAVDVTGVQVTDVDGTGVLVDGPAAVAVGVRVMPDPGGGPDIDIPSLITRPGGPGIDVRDAATVDIDQVDVVDPGGDAIAVTGSPVVAVTDSIVRTAASTPVGLTGIRVEGTGVPAGTQCTTLTGNAIHTAFDPGFTLTDTGLSGYQVGSGNTSETVPAWLTRNGNTFTNVGATNVSSC